ncbi:hypothetical protein ACF07Z_06770 [Streptomyces albidoflavus]|uniref:hypothetical protein n=1 Tax=Streptomyces albidoflavus TaxID=1886 RepID=UPI000249445B|nr:hypothetical protein [Streptomyces albidoflavus]RZD78891.1 hypothetical protein C0Q63_29640 [Streptomyces albidoflavus]
MTTTRRKRPEAEGGAETTGGCLSAALGAAAGLGSWAVAAPRRWPGEFEAGPNWSVLYLDFPAMVLLGITLPLLAWTVAARTTSSPALRAGAVLLTTTLFVAAALGWYAPARTTTPL